MRSIVSPMKHRPLLALALLCSAVPAAAERLEFDHRLYAPLQQVLDSGNKEMIDFKMDNPARMVDLIAVKGTSAHSWTEALEIVSITRPRKMAVARDWMQQVQTASAAQCPSSFTVLAEDENSVTFERRSPGCGAAIGGQGLYRLVAGKKSWFQLAVLSKGDLADPARQDWLTLLGSARLR